MVNTIVAIIIIILILSLSGWVASFFVRLTPFIYFFLGVLIPINENPDIYYNKIVVIIFSLLFAFWFQNAAQKRLSTGLSQVTNTVNISMSGFIIGCLIGTCFTIFIYFFPNIF